MTTTEGPVRSEPSDTGFRAKIGDETFNFQNATLDDRKVTGAQVAEAAGKHPIDEYVVLQQLKSKELETLRPAETADLGPSGIETFFVIKGDATYRFVVDGLNMEWPRKVITGLSIKLLIGKEFDDIELVLERENEADTVIDDDHEVHLGHHGIERLKTRKPHGTITIWVDGEDYQTERRRMSPNQIIKKLAKKDPAENYLIQINAEGTENYQDKGEIPIQLRDGMKFQVISIGPTPVSDPKMRTGVELFLEGLRDFGYEPGLVPGRNDYVAFDYKVQSGRHAGRMVKLGLVVPQDFPMTPPTGPHLSPEIHSLKSDGEHPTGRIQKNRAEVFERALGGSWQYWSRPFPKWEGRNRSVAAYMGHIWKLWDTQ